MAFGLSSDWITIAAGLITPSDYNFDHRERERLRLDFAIY